MKKKQPSWWEKLLPSPNESNEEWIDRVCMIDDYHLVMKEVTNIELAQLAAAYEIAKFRYSFRPGQWAILIIRDIIFCAYGTDFEQTGENIA
jgi:hypothetical protein